ncbi:MAG: hypothetical protein A3F90_16615 [Deltaproteobacteria bacterium RIFCSPLOWO2_12_FULL_60_19]|nr:MAG: hypothetical protein A3F90_16615 [Deltaproteobacteria bacterium RIFCSPLOWO2_12_FULL_60_19]
MKLSGEALRARLEQELGAESVEFRPLFLEAYAVDGKSPGLLCLPAGPEEVASVLRLCAENQASVIPWGGGTSMSLGNIPRAAGVVVGLEKLAQLIEHDDANLTATAQAGMQVAAFQELLGQRRQFFPVDPPLAQLATLGGIVAANVNGPRRMQYGGVRDLTIGMKVALATGEQIKSGGKVVKNVAGYDLCKLFVGSLGTLGIITEVTLRMAPLPDSAASVVAAGPLDRCARFVEQLSDGPLLPAAVTILSAGGNAQTPAVATWVEGFEEAVARQLRDLAALADEAGLASEALRQEPHRRLWEEVEDFGANGEGVLFRIAVPIGAMGEILATIDRWSGEAATPARYVAHAGTGTVWLLAGNDPSSLGWFPRLIALAQGHKGHVVVAAAPPELKAGIDVWGPAPASLGLMREIKRRFDPQEILNPGRFLGGL